MYAQENVVLPLASAGPPGAIPSMTTFRVCGSLATFSPSPQFWLIAGSFRRLHPTRRRQQAGQRPRARIWNDLLLRLTKTIINKTKSFNIEELFLFL